MLKHTMIALASAAAIGVAFVGSAEAASLIGQRDLNTTNDGLLTVVEANGIEYEWLDLTESVNRTVLAASSEFSSLGFQVATTSDMNNLLMAFGYPALSGVPLTFTNGLDPSLNSTFEQFLGVTRPDPLDPDGLFSNGSYTIGLFDGGALGDGLFRTGVNQGNQNADQTLENYASTIPADLGRGVYLVRPVAANDVPEPASLLGLLAVGAVAAGGTLKKKAAA